MEFFIKVTPEQGEIMMGASSLGFTDNEGRSYTCKPLRLEGERLYLEPDEAYKKVLQEFSNKIREEKKL